mmetsp:Transcript_52151/g.124256  ORF Transcript_52151/g.124256 Transcript_52151/m.124256 type:complete len:263 (-) Transcript_52151:389-1177(-)
MERVLRPTLCFFLVVYLSHGPPIQPQPAPSGGSSFLYGQRICAPAEERIVRPFLLIHNLLTRVVDRRLCRIIIILPQVASRRFVLLLPPPAADLRILLWSWIRCVVHTIASEARQRNHVSYGVTLGLRLISLHRHVVGLRCRLDLLILVLLSLPLITLLLHVHAVIVHAVIVLIRAIPSGSAGLAHRLLSPVIILLAPIVVLPAAVVVLPASIVVLSTIVILILLLVIGSIGRVGIAIILPRPRALIEGTWLLLLEGALLSK